MRRGSGILAAVVLAAVTVAACAPAPVAGTAVAAVVTMPTCTRYESALAAQSEMRGYTLRLACDNTEDPASVVGAN